MIACKKKTNQIESWNESIEMFMIRMFLKDLSKISILVFIDNVYVFNQTLFLSMSIYYSFGIIFDRN